MLQVLHSLPPSQAEDVLARALDAFLPNLHEVVLGELERRVIDEARTVVGADDGAVAERLGDELARLMLPPEAEHAAKQRLGHLGELPFSQYEIVFSVGWKGTEDDGDGNFYGISRAEAEDDDSSERRNPRPHHRTVSCPFMFGCGSHTNSYVPGSSFSTPTTGTVAPLSASSLRNLPSGDDTLCLTAS